MKLVARTLDKLVDEQLSKWRTQRSAHEKSMAEEKPKPVCPQCGKENQLGMKFCPSCGTALPSQVENTGFERKPEDISVGVVQASPAVSSHQPPAPAAPTRP